MAIGSNKTVVKRLSDVDERVHRKRARRESDRHAAEHAQRLAQAAERRWVQIVEAGPAAIFALNERGTIMFVNTMIERLLGYSSGELIGKSVEMLVPERFRVDYERFRAGFSDAPEKQQMAVGHDLYAIRKDGSEISIEVALNPIDVDGERLIVGSVVDTTERKMAEAAQQTLHQLALISVGTATMEEVLAGIVDAAIAITHADFGNVQLMDQASSELKIVAQRGFPLWWIDYWNTDSKGHGTCGTALERRERVIVEDVEQSAIFTGNDLVMQRSAGIRAVQSTPLLSRSGKLIGMFSTHYRRPHRPDARTLQLLDLLACQAADIIAEALAEEERIHLLEVEREARAEADAANHAKDLFLARVSHELRTPLNALMGWTRMLRDGSIAAAKVPHAITSIDHNAEVLNKLVEDLVEMSRITTGNLQLQRKHLDIVAVLKEAVNLLELTANAKTVRVETRSEVEPITVDGDPIRLRQVLSNLLSNAIKFTPPHGRVIARARLTDGEVEISVTDSGQGIAPDFVSHVFEPFTQAETSGPGLGLGLAIVQQLVEAHGGRIIVTSEGVGLGATFTLHLPALRVPETV